ncbi:tripartite tricarboxylate transporter TctB family protein [Alphaproteobacteria bacterium]|nr:tripartite tricarboxylate transporter TctB family protein [Alphaproteobacteria bacterium]
MQKKLYATPIFLALFSIAIILISLQLDVSPEMIVGDSMQARSFPIFLMAINLILISVLFLQFFKNYPEKIELEIFTTWFSMFLFLLFYFLTITTDMFIGIAVCMFLMGYTWGEKRLWVNLCNAVITPGLIFLLFDSVLKIRFPRGLLTNIYYG